MKLRRRRRRSSAGLRSKSGQRCLSRPAEGTVRWLEGEGGCRHLGLGPAAHLLSLCFIFWEGEAWEWELGNGGEAPACRRPGTFRHCCGAQLLGAAGASLQA